MGSRIIKLGRVQLRFNPLVGAFVLLAVAGLCRLGIWQLERAGEKIQQQHALQSVQTDKPLSLAMMELQGGMANAQVLQNQPVSLEGEYLNERSLFLIYQPFEEQIGYEIVTPFRLAANGQLVLVSRGWTGAADYATLRATLPRVEGQQQLVAQIHVPSAAEDARANHLTRVQWPLLIRWLNMDELAPLFDAPLFPFVVRLTEGQAGVLVRHWPTVRADSGRNFSYALQWFAMAIAVLLVSLILSSNVLSLFSPAFASRELR